MTNGISRRPAKLVSRVFRAMWVPPRWIEYSYYFAFSYSVIAAYLGIEIRLIAAGITVALGALCFIKMGAGRKQMYAPITPLLACAISFVIIEIVIYRTSILDEIIRAFILWVFGLIIMQSLQIRPGFLLRCTMVMFALGLIAVPHLGYTTASVVERASAGIEIGGGLRNANGLAVWFGFSVVVFGIYALEAKRGIAVRMLYSFGALGSLIIVGLSVSRGAVLGCALALCVGFRSVLKRSFVPVLALIILIGVGLESGLVGQILSNYAERATEETGRILVWPLIFDRIFASPILGVGYAANDTYVPEAGVSIVPHNSFLFFALSSGIVPFAFYTAFWIRAVRNRLSNGGGSEYSAFRGPLLVYALVAFMLADISVEPWALLALTVGGSADISFDKAQLRVRAKNVRCHRSPPIIQSSSKIRTVPY